MLSEREPAMDYEIRGRIHALRNEGYAAIAVASPRSGGPSRQLLDTKPTRDQAALRLRTLVDELGAAIRRDGGEVIEVSTEA